MLVYHRSAVRRRIFLLHYPREGKTVVTFAADGLDHGGADTFFRGENIQEAAHALYIQIFAGRIRHRAFAHDVVHDDDAAAPRQFECPCEVVSGARLVGVDEDQVEGATAFGRELRQCLQRPADAQLNDAGQTRAGKVGPGNFGVYRVKLQRD